MLEHSTAPVKPERVESTRISLVISHCEGDVSWIATFMKEKKYKIKDITIYSKCRKEIKGLERIFSLGPTQIVHYDNVGRNDHSYAHYIKEHYDVFKKEKNTRNDMVFFMKDSDYFFGKNLPFNDMDQMFTETFETGFSCLAKPTCDCNIQCDFGKEEATMMHDAEYLFDFSIDEYSRAERDGNLAFLTKKYPTLKSWYNDIGFRRPISKTIPVCYTGMFAAKKRQILNHPQKVWDAMEKTLVRGDNIVESHYAERTWANLLSNSDERIALQMDRSLLPRVKRMVGRTVDGSKTGGTCGMQGMLYVDAYLRKESKKYSGRLMPNDIWASVDGSHYLTYHNGALFFRQRLEEGTTLLLWRSKSRGQGGYVTLHDSGELEIIDKNGVRVFTNGLSGLTGAYIQINKGRFYILDGKGNVAQSFPPRTDA